MKWERYASMTQEQREEWNFRFGTRPESPRMLGSALLLYSFFMMSMMMIVTIMYVPELAHLKDTVVTILTGAASILYIMAWVMVGEGVLYIVSVVAYEWKSRRWLKARGIK